MIREHPRFERTPIIFVTGVHVSELDCLRGYEVGAIDYISVPVVPRSCAARWRCWTNCIDDAGSWRHSTAPLRQRAQGLKSSGMRNSGKARRAIGEFENPMALTVVIRTVRDEVGEVIDWEYVEANQNALRVFDRTYDQLVGSRLSVALPERASRLMPLCARTLADGKPQRYKMSAGGTDFVMCLFPMSKDVLVGSGFDITVRVQAEQEIKRLFEHDRAEKEWLTAVLDSMNEEVYFTDTDKKHTYANPAAMRRNLAERSFKAFRLSNLCRSSRSIGLPDMDGYEACRRLRAVFGRGMGIVALTGWGQIVTNSEHLMQVLMRI